MVKGIIWIIKKYLIASVKRKRNLIRTRISWFVTPDCYLLVAILCVCSTNRDRRHVAETLRFTQHGQERDSTERA